MFSDGSGVPARKAGTCGGQVLLRRLRWVAALALLICYLPAATALTDEIAAALQCPVLADFEQPLETGRWTGDASFARTASIIVPAR